MHQTEFEDFAKVLRKLSEVFGKKLSDEMTQAYWGALKDQPLSTAIRLAEQHTRYGKFFPKPAELRPKEDRPAVVRDAASDAKFREGEARAVANLEELRKEKPEVWKLEAALRRLDRTLASQPMGSPIYAQALSEWHALRA